MAFADYSFYKETYHGAALSEAEFLRLGVQAAAFIDDITFSKASLSPESEAVRLAECAVAERLFSGESREGIKSETVGRHSVTYRDGGAAKSGEYTGLYDAAARFLGPSGLLYRGC